MVVGRSMHERWLSNAYVLGDAPGGAAVFVDSGAPLGRCSSSSSAKRLTPTHLLRTHTHGDHVEHEDELRDSFGIPVVTGDLATGDLTVRALSLPGHSDDGVAFVVNDEVVLHGRRPLQGRGRRRPCRCLPAVGDDGLMELPPETRVLPGHTDETTIGREWESNPFVTYWRGVVPSLGERVRVGGEDAELVVWSPDYDGKGKALVRLADGTEAIVGGSRVERG